MFSVISCLGATHDWRFVAGAIVVCLIGTFSTVMMLARAQECAPKHTRHWIAAAAGTGGTSIWATHFIAMLAYDGGYPLAYDGVITGLSLLASIAMSWAAFAAAFGWLSPLGVVGAGGMFGIGTAAMHFTGMLAIMMQGHLTYAPGSVAAAVAASLFFGSLALLVIRFLAGQCELSSPT
ncbi:MAG: diguanylate cyclase/phosphodiesterase [Devosia sp.]|nr:diguanylate cyclase/phosphodiesterase [Devosia sp.]